MMQFAFASIHKCNEADFSNVRAQHRPNDDAVRHRWFDFGHELQSGAFYTLSELSAQV